MDRTTTEKLARVVRVREELVEMAKEFCKDGGDPMQVWAELDVEGVEESIRHTFEPIEELYRKVLKGTA